MEVTLGRVETAVMCRRWAASVAVVSAMWLAALSGCTPLPANGPEGAEASMPPLALTWYKRAKQSYEALDVDAAEVALASCRRLAPEHPSVRLLAARVALAQLRPDEAIQALEGLGSVPARQLLIRAHWQAGQVEQVMTRVDRLMADSAEKPEWLRNLAALTRSGSGREPYRIAGANLAVVPMLKTPAPVFVLPVELNGEQVLAMVATRSAEVVVDSSQGSPTWVSLRFGGRLEVKDVPAVTRDLKSVSEHLGAPIGILLGTNLLRRLHATVDFHGGQFIARAQEPTPPPNMAAVPLHYLPEGDVAIRSSLREENEGSWARLLLDTEQLVTLTLTEAGWRKAGVSAEGFTEVPGQPTWKQSVVPRLRLGAFDIPKVPGVLGLPVPPTPSIGPVEGVLGSTLLAEFRWSFADEGRVLWLEPMPTPLGEDR